MTTETLMVGKVNQSIPVGKSDGAEGVLKLSKRLEACVLTFFEAMALEGRIYTLSLGTITTPVTGDIAITDAAAEISADAAKGYTIFPVYLNVNVESINGGTLPECYLKSVAAVSTSGTIQVAQPWMTNGIACAAICRADDAGGVVVPAETVTTTRIHYAKTITAQADGLLADIRFMVIPIFGPACFYVQVAGTTAGPTYFANVHFAELPSAAV